MMRIFGGLIGDVIESVTEPIEDLFKDSSSEPRKNFKKYEELEKKVEELKRVTEQLEKKEPNYTFDDIMDLIVQSSVDADTKITTLIAILRGIPELRKYIYGEDVYKRAESQLKQKSKITN
jgi:hypothetical protein